MAEAFVVDAVRTPVGRRGGGLAGAHPADLGAHVIRALLARADLGPLADGNAALGCGDAVGPQAAAERRWSDTGWAATGGRWAPSAKGRSRPRSGRTAR